MKKTQQKWVEEQLRTTGEISRNTCLSQFISRLSAIIQDLEAEGWEFKPSKRKGDYVYTLVSAPFLPPKPTYWITERDGTRKQVV